MKLRERTRAYSLAMAVLNAGVATFLFYLSRLGVTTGVGGALTATLGPALTVVFMLVAIGWLVDTVRPNELGDVLPKIRPRPRRGTGSHPDPGLAPTRGEAAAKSETREQHQA